MAALLKNREHVLSWVASWLDEPSCAFLRSVENERANFALIDLPFAVDLPGVRRKLHNLAQRTAAKRMADRLQLDAVSARIHGASRNEA